MKAWAAQTAATSDPAQLFHSAALILKKQFGFETLNIFAGDAKKTLVAIHHAGSSYLADDLDRHGNLAGVESGQILGETKTFILEKDQPKEKTLVGSIMVARIPGYFAPDGLLLLASEASAPAYHKSDLQELQPFCAILSPLLANAASVPLKKKATELSTQLKETQKQSREALKLAEETQKAKIQEIEQRLNEEREQLTSTLDREIDELQKTLSDVTAKANNAGSLLETATSRVTSLQSALQEEKETILAKDNEILLLKGEKTALAKDLETIASRERAVSADRIAELELLLEDAKNAAEKERTKSLSELRLESETQLEDLRAGSEAKLKELRNRGETELKELRTRSEAQLIELRNRGETELKELRTRSEAQEKKLREESEIQLKRIKSDLDEVVTQKNIVDERLATLEKDLARVTEEARVLREEIEARDQLLSETGVQSSRKEAELLKKAEEHARQLQVERGQWAKERTDLEAQQNKLRAEIASAQQNTNQVSGNLKNEITKLDQNLKQEQERFHKELVFQEAKNRELASHLEDEKRKLSAEQKRAGEEIARIQTAIAQKERELNETKSSADKRANDLRSELAKRAEEITSLRGEIERRTGIAKEQSERIAALEKNLDELKKRQANTENELRNREEKIKRADADLQRARGEIYKVQEERTEANKKIKALEELLLSRDRDLKQQSEEIVLRDDEIARLSDELKSIRTEREKLQTTEAALRKELGHYRERETRLEQDLLALQDDKRQLGGKIEAQQEEIVRHRDRIQKEIRERESVISELTNVRGKEKRLGEELQSALNREKGSREEGVILFNFARALSEVQEFQAKLEALRKGLSARIGIARMFAYSLRGDSYLRLEEGFAGEEWLRLKRRPYVSLSETVMGTALATVKPDSLGSGMLEIPDAVMEQVLPVAQAKGKGGVILPLTESGETLGVLCIVCDATVPESEMRLLANLSPFIATSLRQRLDDEDRKAAQVRLGNKDAIIGYLETRLHKRGLEINPLRKAEEQMAAFEVWAHNLARMCEEKGIAIELQIAPQTLLKLSDRVPSPTHLHYIALEAVENIRNHSEATSMAIRLAETDGAISLIIEDNGEGLLRTAGTDNPTRGAGIPAIRSLAFDSGAECRMSKGDDGRGLRIECVWQSGPG